MNSTQDLLKELNELDEKGQLDEEYLTEMANATKNDTGLPYDIWLDSAGKNRKNKRSEPRFKVSIDNDLIPISISKDPKVLIEKEIKKWSLIKKFVVDNYEDLMKHWNGELTDREILNILYDKSHLRNK